MFQLFAWREGEQRGGFDDYLKTFATFDEAFEFAMDLLYDFDWQIVDTEKQKIVSHKEEQAEEYFVIKPQSFLKELN